MARFKGHMGNNMVVLYLIFILNAIELTEAAKDIVWYTGCYTVSDPGVYQNVIKMVDHPVECSKHCFSQSYIYTVIVDGDQCGCSNDTTHLNSQLPDDSCAMRCGLYPCGGANYRASIYLSAGPFLHNAKCHVVESPIYTDDEFSVEVDIHLASLPDIAIGVSDLGFPGHPERIAISWTLNGSDPRQENITLSGPYVRHGLINSISEAGFYLIDVEVSNILSILRISTNVTVLLPEPSDLQMTLVTGKDQLPSCMPEDVQPEEEGKKAVVVFAGDSVVFEATVAVGHNITFEWVFSDDDTRVVHNPTSEHCKERQCTTAIQSHVFASVGHFLVTANASNALGTLQDSIFVMVVRRELTNLVFVVHKDSPMVATPNTLLRFLVSMETTARHEVTLQVTFGDGSKKEYKLKDSFLYSKPEDESDSLLLLSNYTDGNCTLNFELRHMYNTQGEFQPKLTVMSNFATTKILRLDTVIKIINRLTPPILTGPAAVAVNRVVNLSAASMRNTPNVTYHWSVVDEEQLEEHNLTTKEPSLSHQFNKPGLFTVQMKARNAINSVRVSMRINVLYPVSDLSLFSEPDQLLRTGEQASFSAELASGTAVEYEWDFSDPGGTTLMGQQNLSAYANHTFHNAGAYNISVRAYNAVSQLTVYLGNLIVVQDPVGDLDVVLESPVLNETNVTMIVTVNSGTDVMVSVDFGEETEHYGKINGCSMSIIKTFSEVKEHHINVTAFNNISSVTKALIVDVQKGIGIINVSLPSKATVTDPVIFAVYDGGDLSKRDDLVYTWLINGTVASRTRVPVIDKRFEKTGLYQVSVVAKNDVANASAMQPVIVEADESNARFANPSVAFFNETTRLVLKNLPDGPLEIRVKYTESHEETLSNVEADNITLEYTFPEAGVYEVSAIIYVGGRREADVDTVIAVQEPLFDLKLSGPSAVPLNRSSIEYTWNAETGSGSHILFEWFINNELAMATTQAKLTWRFRHAGVYNVSVRASNSLASLTANSSVAVEYSISRVQLQVPPTVRGRAAQLVLIVRGGPNVNLSISYGDGETVVLSSNDLTSENLTTPTDVVHRYNLSYNYSQVGVYEVSVNVSNHVSYMMETSRAAVEEPIEGIVLTSSNSRVVRLGQSVTVGVTIASGNDLVCDWDFSDVDRPASDMNCSDSQTTHTFSRPGNYTVRVFVSSNLYNEPVVAELPQQFYVIQEIAGLDLKQQEGQSAVMLVRGRSGEMTTRQVVFVGSVEEGSDIIYTFNYGDGSAEEEVRPGTGKEAFGKHSFTSANAYNITVSGRNLLSNMTASLGNLFHVQVAPMGLQLDRNRYTVAFGNSTTFKATLQEGTNVVFDWDMGDGALYKDTGPLVEHQYRKVGKFPVTLSASNQVGQVEAKAQVDVTEPLQGVRLRVNVTMAAVNTRVRLIAEPYPINVSVLYYEWDVGTPRNSIHQTQGRELTPAYDGQGTYTISVVAHDQFGSKMSNPVRVQIVVPLTEVTLSVSGEQLVNRTLEFIAKHYKGSDVTYIWNFGDGSGDIESEEMRELYTFERTGEFNVMVTARNPLGNYSASTHVFILKRPCRPPSISILSTPGGQVYRSSDLKVEAEVIINCSITSSAKYRWFLTHSDSHQELTPDSLFPSSQHDAIFYLPPRSLEYGNYTLNLTVEMFETTPRVYSKAYTHFEVIKSPLLAVIAGGINRHASRQENVTLDASTSSDPDNPSYRNFKYEWSCYPLNKPGKSCFHGNKTMASWVGSKQDVLVVPGSAFNDSVDDFVFHMTLSMPGRRPSNTSQVLTMQQQRLINVKVGCRECDDHVINSDQKMVLFADHPGVEEDDVRYEWQVYIVPDDKTDPTSGNQEGGTCVPTDRSVYQQFHQVRASDAMRESSSSSKPTQKMTTSTTTTTTATTPQTTTTEAAGIPINPFPMIKESTSSGGRGSAGEVSIRGEGLAEGSLDFPPIRENSGGGGSARGSSMGEGLPSIGEALPGEAGSAGGRRPTGVNPPVGPSEGSTGGRNTANSGTRPSADQKEGDEATDAISQPAFVWHIVSRIRYPIIIKPEDTSTGFKQRVLVIKKGVLKQGTTYVVKVKVNGKENKRVGTALVYFEVNRSPSKGECDITPYDEGIEMKTEFRVHCRGWKDENKPIHYEVSYRLAEQEERKVVYRGLNHLVTFQLPAGYAHCNYTVEVFISILDSLGARTRVCSLPITVRPRSFSAINKTEEQILYDIVKGDESPLQIYVSSGDNRNVRLQTQLVAHRLNRLNSSGEDPEQRNMRRQIREAMLQALHDLPMRDEYEVQQTTAAVASSTAVTNELEVASLVFASDILEKAVRQVETLASRGKQLDTTNIAFLTIDGAANILAAVTTPDVAEQLEKDLTTPSPLPFVIEYEAPTQVEEVVQKSRNAVHAVLKSEMQQWVAGENVFTKDTGNLLTEAGCFRASVAYTRQSQLTNFVLPSNMEQVLNTNVKVKQGNSSNMEEDCYQAHMLTFRTNPYIYSKNRQRQVQTQVASLTLFTCDGQELSVDGLPADDLVNMHIPHQDLNSQSMKSEMLTLEKHHMNVHQFNVSGANLDQSLHIHVELEPAKDKHVFPISILVSVDGPPNPENYFIRKNFGRELENLKVYVEANKLEAGKQYYIGLVDVEYNAGRPREGEVRQRQYRLWLWWGDCLYWKEADNEWSPDGCHVSPAANFSHIQCNCNHLTSFGAHFSLAPNDLSFTDVEALIDLHENPVTFVFVLSIFVLYFILLAVSIKLDRHDSMKGSIVHLVDNRNVDKQTYMVTLETGFRKGAGTTAKVSLVLHGEQGMSEMRELVSESGQLLFERNSRDTFIVTLKESLGKVWKVQLWHNNAGQQPSWYLSRVTVKDLTAGHTYYFSCEKWFAVEEDDGKIEREIMLQDGGLGFGKVLWAKGTQYFADFHLWLSVFSRPSYSRFTRAQRLTCALSLLLSYMAVNAAWYQFREKEYRGEFGLIDLSWRSVFVGIITALLVLPVNFIIVLIFRRSKVSKVRLEEFPEKKHFANKRDSLSSLDSTVRLLQPVVTQSIFDQSMINWQNLQEWAQRQWAKRYQQSVNSSLQNVKPPNPQQVQMADTVPPGATDANVAGNVAGNVASNNQATPDIAAGQTDPVDLAAASPEVGDSAAASNRSSASLGPPSQRRRRGQEDQPRAEDATGQSREPLLRNRSTHSEPSGHSSNNSFSIATSTEGSRHQPPQLLLIQGGCISYLRSEKKKERCFLPSWCIYIAWILSVVIILGCATITILYGFRFGRARSIMWLQSLFFSFIQCVFITHPFIILIISVVTAIRYHDDLSVFDHHNDGVLETFQEVVNNDGSPPPYTEKEEEFDLATGIAQRQRSRYLRFARPPQEKHLIEARKTTLKQRKTGAVFSETLSFSILLFLLLVVAFGKDSQTPFRLNSTLETLLTKTGSLPFKDIQTVDQWWQWSHNDLLDLVYADGLGKDMVVGNSQLVGQVSIRQKRVKPSLCGLPTAYTQFSTCHGGYSKSASEASWFAVDNFTMPYKEKDQTGASCVVGRFAYYDSAGHQVFLPRDKTSAAAMLEDLYNYEWLGHQTRAVIVEFVLFHAPSNLFSSVHLVLEIPPLGRAFPYTDITSAYVYKYISHFDNFILACELLLIIFTMILLHSEVESAIRMRKEYIKSPWNCVQVTVLCLLMAYIACYLYRYVLVGNVVSALRKSYNSEFVDTSFIAYWDHLLNSFLGFIIFLLLVMSLRLLRNQPLFSKYGAIYKKTVHEIITFGCLFLVWVCAYTSLGVALYSAISLDFSRWDRGLGTVVGLMTRHYDLQELDKMDPHGSRLLVISFLLLALSSLTGYIVAVLIYHLKRHHSSGLPPLSTSQALRYLWNRLVMFAQLEQPRYVHEDDGGLPPEFTMAEIEYQVEEMLFKMNALAGTSGLPDKPSQYFTDSDCTYPSPGEDAVSSGSEPRFDDGRFERRINKIEDNLVSYEPHLAQLLQLDAIGARILTAEHEKQIRSQLELEIFRRLQLQRPDVRPHHTNRLPSSGSNSSGKVQQQQASNSSSGCQASAEASPSPASPPGHSHKSFFLPTANTAGGAGNKDGRVVKSQGGSKSSSKPTQLPSGDRGADRVKMSDGLILQDLSEKSGGCQDTAIPLQEIKRPAPVAAQKTAPAVTRSSLEDQASGSSCSSGAAEIQYVLNLKKARDLAKDLAKDIAKDMAPVTKPANKLIVDSSTVYDALQDSSSGSEGEIAPAKARSLRKTKSRGKGKGRRGHGDGFDDFAFDNHAFDNHAHGSGSDRENKKDSTLKRKHATKQAWM